MDHALLVVEYRRAEGHPPQKRHNSKECCGYIRVSDGPLAAAARPEPMKPSEGERIMLYVRTAYGAFINAATIIQLSPLHAGRGNDITGWVAICEGGKAVSLASYYAAPGRIEAVLAAIPGSAEAISVFATETALACFSEDCPCP
jgi:hypothetical protein